MGIPKNYHKNTLGRKKIKVSVLGCEINVNMDRIGEKIDRAQDILDDQVWSDVQMYMPKNTGNLIQQTNMINNATRGEVYLYPPELDYGHYQYEGIKFVDPVYKKGAFYSPEYGFWSRPGVDKIPSGEPLSYSNPKAEAHWGDVAMQNHKSQWIKVAKNALKKG